MNDKVKWERAEAPVLLSRAAATRLLDPWLAGRTILGVEWMGGGLMNRNYLVELDGRPAQCVLRVYVRDAATAAKEVAVLGLVGRDIPVPRVLFAEERPQDGQPPFAVLSFIEGASLFALRQSGDAAALADACYDAGRTLARIGAYPGPPTPFETVIALVDRFVGAPAFQERIGAERTKRIVRLAEAWQPRLADVGREQVLVHGDFNSANIFVKPAADGWRVSGILDWEFALSASPYCDIGNFLRYHRADRPRYEPDFSRGLRDAGIDLPDDWLMLARLFDLPALCELLGRPSIPDVVVTELVTLIDQTTAEA